MNDMTKPQIREELFQSMLDGHKADRSARKTVSTLGFWVGGVGAGIGILGMTAAVACMVWIAPKSIYRTIDLDAGVISEGIGAEDAPKSFNERVVEHYLSEYVKAREQWVRLTDPANDHLVKLMSAPDEQQRYADQKAKFDPGSRYGTTGYAQVRRIVSLRKRNMTTALDGTREYDVQFIKTEVMANDPSKTIDTRETARIIFQFHPELPTVTLQDRLDNESGLMVFNYHADRDQ